MNDGRERHSRTNVSNSNVTLASSERVFFHHFRPAKWSIYLVGLSINQVTTRMTTLNLIKCPWNLHLFMLSFSIVHLWERMLVFFFDSRWLCFIVLRILKYFLLLFSIRKAISDNHFCLHRVPYEFDTNILIGLQPCYR